MTYEDDERSFIIKIISGIVLVATILITGGMYGCPKYTVYVQEHNGKAALAKAEQERQILVEQARAERDAAEMQAEAIAIMGEAAKKFPEYRNQQFISAFSEAMQRGTVSQIIYVPTEANIPILEAGKR